MSLDRTADIKDAITSGDHRSPTYEKLTEARNVVQSGKVHRSNCNESAEGIQFGVERQCFQFLSLSAIREVDHLKYNLNSFYVKWE